MYPVVSRSPNAAMISGATIPGIALPKPEPAPLAEDNEARSTSFSDIAESNDPIGILNIVYAAS